MQHCGFIYVTLTVFYTFIGKSTSYSDISPPTPCEDGLPFCETTDDYPTFYINQLLKIQPEYILRYFNKPVEPSWSVSKRDVVGMDLCPSRSRQIYPTKVNGTNKTDFIVNTNENRQGVMIEECTHTKECPVIKDLTKKYKSVCKQKKMWRTMVVFNPENKTGMVTKAFEFPSGCGCSLIPVHET